MYIERNSPHIRRRRTVNTCMRHVILALMPTTVCALYFFGWHAALTLSVATVACAVAELLIVRLFMDKSCKPNIWSAILTGLLLGLNLPSTLPVWMIILGSLMAIGIGKMVFGGLGCNIFNPALVGRVFLLISFPVAMTTWPVPGGADGATGATLLTRLKESGIGETTYQYVDMLVGAQGGSMGEVASAALLLGLAYMLYRRIITWHIPVSIIATVVLFDLCIGFPPLLDILSGGLLLGAIFMATDYVTSPMTGRGMIVFGIGIGVITVIIRRWGAYPEGVSFAILIMNAFVPLINRYSRPRRFGVVKTAQPA